MKTKVLLLSCTIMLTIMVQSVVATSSYIPLTIIDTGSNDGPAQDGKDPITPNQFVASLDDRTLTISTTLKEAISLQLKNQATQEKVTSVKFTNTVSLQISKYGSYGLLLNIHNTTLQGVFEVELSQNEVANIALDMYQNEAVEIFVSSSTYSKGDTIHALYEHLLNEYTIIENNSAWCVFIDKKPEANWGHECQYLLVDSSSGKIKVLNRTTPPVALHKFKQYKFYDRMNGAKILNKQDAFAIVDSMYRNDTVSIYISNDFYYGGEKFDLPTKEIINVPYPLAMYWVAFVDLFPMANWSHPCEYIFINAYTGHITKITKSIFPKNLQGLFNLMRWDNRKEEDGLVLPEYNRAVPKLNESKKQMHREAMSNSSPDEPEYHKWAIIINGGADPNNNWVRYWNDCSAVYKTLISNGYNPEQIFVAISDGLNDSVDIHYNNGSYGNSPWDLDGDGNNDVQFPATRIGITDMFEMVRDSMNGNDEVFIFTTDHGDTIDGHSVLWLWNDEFVYDFEFANLVDRLGAGTLNIVMEQCYSGGFIDDFQNPIFEQVVVSTACGAEQPSYSMYNFVYDEFIYWWCTAINGVTPDGIVHGSADYNNDGYISMLEAYMFACANDAREESPQQYSNDECLKFSLTLTDLLSLCDSPVFIDGYDLYIKDNASDLGTEPNYTTGNSWISTDIWFENINGGRVSTLQQGCTYRVCARVHNRGNQPTPGGELIYWHWTKAVIGGSWPYSWFDNYEYTCDTTSIIRGAVINPNGTMIPSINGGENCIVSHYWTAPSIDYSACSVFNDNLDQLWHYCLLARIVDSQSQPGEDGEPQPLAAFVLNNNNVASCNFSMIGPLRTSNIGLPAAIVGVATPNMTTGYYHLYCDVFNSNLELGTNRHLYLTLSPDLFSNWSGYGIGYDDINGQGQLEITGNHAELLNIYMNGNGFYPLKVELYDTTNIKRNVTFDIHIVDSNGDIVGGERFMYSGNGENGVLISPNYQNAEQQLNSTHSLKISCVPNPAFSRINVVSPALINLVNIYNQQGQIVISTTDTIINVSNLPKGVYFIYAETKEGNSQTKFIKQ